ncbi:chromogranin-A isoform X1 [Physeter macrocephalus]|uniref:Chromogranin-A n=1 Tax=Physeter macrocephalus TaxID=9755 RepID=A0A2Y9T7F2_PHYMC|nr:chromogranin-A isoform X1 [Physeter catodon]|eukprot:XP_023986851.1 chromogranin-A isoform X1 [Physeter catodon]
MRSAAVLALLLCAGQVVALPVNSPMNKGDAEVMKCTVEVISDTLSTPSPKPVSRQCFETLRGDERILSILRHQNLLKELQDLALQGAKERAHQQKKHSSYEDELSEVLEKQNGQAELKEGTEEASSKDATEKRGDSKEVERHGEDADGARPQATPELGQGSKVEEDNQAPGEEEASSNTHPLASLSSQKHPGPQAEEDSEGPSQGPVGREKGLSAEQGQQAKREEEEEEEEEEEAGEKAVPEEESPPTAAFNPHPSLGYKEMQRGESWPEAPAVDGAGKTGAQEAPSAKGKGEREHSQQQQQEEEEEEQTAGAPQGLFRGGKSGEPGQQEEEERLSKEWEGAQRWSSVDQLAKELTAEKRLEGEEEEEEDPDRAMKLSFRARGYDFRGPGLQLRRGWRPSSREDSVEAGLPLQVRGYPEEKKEEEGSANRRPEDQELESLSAIEAELEKVAHELQGLRRG